MKILIIIICATYFAIVGCSTETDYEKSVKKTEECLKKKAENLKYSNIDEAVANYDFETARNLLSCYSKEIFKFDGRVELSGYGGGSAPSAHTTNLRTIVRAEVSYLINNNMIERAKAVAAESDDMDLFTKQLPKIITQYASQGDFEKAFGLIIEYPFRWRFESRYSSNDAYNDEVNQFNNLIDVVLNYAIIGKYNDIARKCLQFYKPISVSAGEGCKLVDSPREQARKRINF